MKFQFLGTGTSQGVPAIGCDHPVCLSSDPRDKRMRASGMLTGPEGQKLLIDCGPDFRMQMLTFGHQRLDAVLLTHEHNDHIIGLDDTRPIIFSQQEDLAIYAQPRVIEQVKKRFAYAFAPNPYPGSPQFRLHSLDNEAFFVKGIEIQPLPVEHYLLPIYGYRIGNFAYITDASRIPDTTFELLKGVEVLVINALRISPKHPAHFTLGEALDIIEKTKTQRAYLTHMSHLIGFHQELSESLPPHIQPAYDGLEIKF